MEKEYEELQQQYTELLRSHNILLQEHSQLLQAHGKLLQAKNTGLLHKIELEHAKQVLTMLGEGLGLSTMEEIHAYIQQKQQGGVNLPGDDRTE